MNYMEFKIKKKLRGKLNVSICIIIYIYEYFCIHLVLFIK